MKCSFSLGFEFEQPEFTKLEFLDQIFVFYFEINSYLDFKEVNFVTWTILSHICEKCWCDLPIFLLFSASEEDFLLGAVINGAVSLSSDRKHSLK